MYIHVLLPYSYNKISYRKENLINRLSPKQSDRVV